MASLISASSRLCSVSVSLMVFCVFNGVDAITSAGSMIEKSLSWADFSAFVGLPLFFGVIMLL